MEIFTGDDLDVTYTRKEIQESLYNALGIPQENVFPTYRDKMEFSFTLRQVNEMEEDEFNHYFDMGYSCGPKGGEPKSSFKEANKKMKAIEEKSKDIVSKMSAVTNGFTYENYLKSTTPKSSFKEANKRMKAIEDASD